MKSSILHQLNTLRAVAHVKNNAQLAKELGISTQAVYSAIKKEQIPEKWKLKIANKFNVPAGIFEADSDIPLEKFYHSEFVEKDNSASSIQFMKLTLEGGGLEYILLPILSPTMNEFTNYRTVKRTYPFRLDFLTRLGKTPERMVLMTVAGESMSPAINDGDLVLIDLEKTTPIPGKLFAVAIEKMVYIKEIDAVPGKTTLKSANPNYPHIEFETFKRPPVEFVGMVVWHCHEW